MVILIGCSTGPLTMKVNDSQAFRNANSIEILDFSTEGATIKYEGNADYLGPLKIRSKVLSAIKWLSLQPR